MTASMMELEAVLAVARTGGFRAAARELDVSSSALSHAIASLEERLGVRLFNRTTRSVSLSAAGEQFVAEVAPALGAIRSAIDHAGEHADEPTGALRLNMSTTTARVLLKPLILEYQRRYPRVDLEIVTDDALSDVIGQGCDAGIRPTETVQPDMIAVPIAAPSPFRVVGAPAYFEGRPRPTHPGQLGEHRCIRARLASGRIWRWELKRGVEAFLIEPPGSLILDENGLVREAAVAGAGLAYLLDEAAVREDLAAGRLISVLSDWTTTCPGLSLYYAGRRNLPSRLRAFIDLTREVDIRGAA
ncbi:MAG: LysR family transcriptional regulator [Caulobacteraceae bacterium]